MIRRLPEEISNYIEKHEVELFDDEIDSIVEFLIPNIQGKVFFDVGARKGIWSVIASLAGAIEIHIFEPNRRELTNAVVNTFNTRSDRQFNLNTCSDVIWSSRGFVAYNNWSTGSGDDRISETLDWYSKRVDNVGFIKIDTEGAEIEILNGAKELLEKHRPLLMVEDHNNRFEEIRGMLNNMYYEPIPMRDFSNHRHLYFKDIRLAP